ncbi:MAG: type II secretion system protein [Planctomycetes bacterium]|nr:type II secretion system protein [Planctomycetota bacterium]
MNRTRAFTLIELLMVLAIIMILASMLLVGIPHMLFVAKALDTEQRMESVLNGIQLAGHADGDIAYSVQRTGMGDDFTWSSLRTAIERFKAQGTLQSQKDDLPPNIKLRIAGPPQMASPNFRIDNQICWLLRDSTGTEVKTGGWKVGADDYYSDSRWNPIAPRSGESLELTMEVLPDTQQPTAWYLTRWPTLVETGVAPTLNQTSWPASDWDKPSPGVIPPIWSSPWGRPILSRSGELIEKQYDQHSLDQLSPLYTIRMLQMAGVLEPGSAGADSYRTDRGRNRRWNDRWGHPLVVTAAVFLPPRYDFGTRPDGTPEDSVDLRGGRDFLLRKAKEHYSYSRAVYLSVGAIGPKLRTPLPASWIPANDAVNLRNLWLQIRDVTEASKWNQDSFSKPVWKGGMKRGRNGEERCFVKSPVEVK